MLIISFLGFLGIILQNETKNDEMVAIRQALHQYVPCVPYTEWRIVSNGEEEIIERAKFHPR